MSWICKKCETENPDRVKVCEVCGKPRERSSVDVLRDKLGKKYSGELYKSLIQDHYKLLDLADKGNTDAQYEVGEWFRKSNSLLACEESVRWYKVAADGNCRAMFKLGVSYEYGCGVIKDIDIARFWYQKAAEQGYEPAKQCLLRIDPVQNGEKEAVNNVGLFIFFIIVSLIGGLLGGAVFALLRDYVSDYVTIPITDEMQIVFVIGGAITLNLLLWLWNGLTDS